MAEVKQDVMYKKKYLETIANLILNNEQLSDVTFVVNKKHYHASRIHVSAASQVFASLLNEHFANTTDKELVLTNIKHNASLFNILQYIHGIELNLTSMSKLVLCELTHLAERFKLAELHDDLKAHVSNIKRFKMNSVVPMLNTARTYNLTKLYDKLKEYVYQRAEQIVNHQSFLNLKYDVVIDLLKSNWLYAKEIDILRAALNWHDDNIIDPIQMEKSQMNNDNNEFEMESENEGNLNDENIPSEYDAWSEIHIVEEFLSKYSEELFDFTTQDSSEVDNSDEYETISSQDLSRSKEPIDETHDSSKLIENESTEVESSEEAATKYVNGIDDSDENINLSNEDNSLAITETDELTVAKRKDKTALERFSENILDVLLKHIRFSRIPLADFLTTADTMIFLKYKDVILKRQCNNLNIEPRICYNVPRTKFSRFLFTVNHMKHFMESSLDEDIFCSQESYSTKHCKWNILASKNEIRDVNYLGLHLACTSERQDWNINISYQITLLSHDIDETNIAIKDYKCLFCRRNVRHGKFYFVNFSTLRNFIQDDSILVEVLVQINS
uniref:BTB/POZ domain-containing protein 9 n=1 Tax=Cacopsylla melanoneura TaxID=428564 RepID=A0A8D8U8G9_9HEMI